MTLIYYLMEWNLFGSYYVPMYLLFVIEIWVSSFFLMAGQKRKSKLYIRVPLAGITSIGFAIGLGFLRTLSPGSVILQIALTFFLYGKALLDMFIILDEKPLEVILTWISMLAIREAADSLDSILKVAMAGSRLTILYFPSAPLILNLLFSDVVHLSVQIPFGLVMARFRGINADRAAATRVAVLSFAFISSAVVVKSIVVTFSEESKSLYICINFLMFFISALILLIRTDILLSSKRQREIDIFNAILLTQEQEFENSKQSIALINAKIHDIRHRIDDLGDAVAESTLAEIKSSIEIYDRAFHTDSQVLDTILYTKSLEANVLGIRISAMGSAKAIHGIPSSERYYLFSNIIDNAMEAVKEVDDPEKKIIGIVLEETPTEFHIDSYNYFKGERILLEDGFKTTKKEKEGHGLGTKSIRFFAQEHGGEVRFSVKEDMFFLSIILPLPVKNGRLTR